jgi:hypothetical protein
MKDPYSVLRAKERDLDRVRKEVQLLRAVIPLLADEQPSADGMQEVSLVSSRTPADSPDNDTARLERYHTFAEHSGLSEGTKR